MFIDLRRSCAPLSGERLGRAGETPARSCSVSQRPARAPRDLTKEGSRQANTRQGAQRSRQKAFSARKINRGKAKSTHRWGLSAPVPPLNDTRSASSGLCLGHQARRFETGPAAGGCCRTALRRQRPRHAVEERTTPEWPGFGLGFGRGFWRSGANRDFGRFPTLLPQYTRRAAVIPFEVRFIDF